MIQGMVVRRLYLQRPTEVVHTKHNLDMLDKQQFRPHVINWEETLGSQTPIWMIQPVQNKTNLYRSIFLGWPEPIQPEIASSGEAGWATVLPSPLTIAVLLQRQSWVNGSTSMLLGTCKNIASIEMQIVQDSGKDGKDAAERLEWEMVPSADDPDDKGWRDTYNVCMLLMCHPWKTPTDDT